MTEQERALVKDEDMASMLEQVVIGGDLSRLSPQDRVTYYRKVCDSLGLNPLTQPFRYLTLHGQLTLYATRAAADQLRKINGVSITDLDVDVSGDMAVVTCSGATGDGRSDTDVGVVPLDNLRGDNRANAILKAVTKAKRRMTLSLCGLGWLDETEVETIPGAKQVSVTSAGEIANGEHQDKHEAKSEDKHWIDNQAVRSKFWAWARNDLTLTDEQVHDALGVEHVRDYQGTKADAFRALEGYAELLQRSEREEREAEAIGF